MAKLFTYIIVLYGTLLLLSLAGLPTGASDIIDKFSGDTFWVAIISLATLCIGGGLVISRLTQTSPDLYVAAFFALGSLIPLVVGFSGIVTLASTYSDWIYYLVLVVFGVLGVGYLIACAEWILNRGSN